MVRRVVSALSAGILGFVAAAAVSLAAQGGPSDHARPPAAPSERPLAVAISPRTVLVWTPLRMPVGFAAAARRLPVVSHLVQVRSGVAWMTLSTSADGSVVDRARAGYAIPLETAAASPSEYRYFLPPGDQQAIVALSRGEAILGSSSAELRRLGPGSTLRLGAVSLRVGAVLPDELVGANEMLVSTRTGARLGISRPRYVLIDPVPGTETAPLDRALHRLLPAGMPMQLRTPGSTPYFRQGDAVLPQVKLKQMFGEFAARRVGRASLQIDPAWVAAHIVTRKVPLLGRITCNRGIMPPLVGALQEVKTEGLGHLIDPRDSGPCYMPGFLNGDPALNVSHASWGITIDINTSQNPYGGKPRMDPRVVKAFADWGFTWGGRWMVPFGAQFEYVGSPPGSQ